MGYFDVFTRSCLLRTSNGEANEFTAKPGSILEEAIDDGITESYKLGGQDVKVRFGWRELVISANTNIEKYLEEIDGTADESCVCLEAPKPIPVQARV